MLPGGDRDSTVRLEPLPPAVAPLPTEAQAGAWRGAWPRLFSPEAAREPALSAAAVGADSAEVSEVLGGLGAPWGPRPAWAGHLGSPLTLC